MRGRWPVVGHAVPVSLATLGSLETVPAPSRPDLLGPSVAAFLAQWPDAAAVGVAQIDPDVSDTAAFTQTYGVPPEVSANCVVVAGKREGVERVAACMVLATTRADVNGAVRRLLDVRKSSFLAVDDAVSRTGMEYGGITPVGLPDGWRVLVDARVVDLPAVVVGSGVRRSKLVLPGALLGRLPGAEVVEGLANPVPA